MFLLSSILIAFFLRAVWGCVGQVSNNSPAMLVYPGSSPVTWEMCTLAEFRLNQLAPWCLCMGGTFSTWPLGVLAWWPVCSFQWFLSRAPSSTGLSWEMCTCARDILLRFVFSTCFSLCGKTWNQPMSCCCMLCYEPNAKYFVFCNCSSSVWTGCSTIHPDKAFIAMKRMSQWSKGKQITLSISTICHFDSIHRSGLCTSIYMLCLDA